MIGRAFMAVWFAAVTVPLDWQLVDEAATATVPGAIAIGLFGVLATVGLLAFAGWLLLYD